MEPVKFVALDSDDLEVVSTHLQDAEVKVADVHWRPKENRLVLGVARFDWMAASAPAPEFRRCRSALRFDRVLAANASMSTRPARTRCSTCSPSISPKPNRRPAW